MSLILIFWESLWLVEQFVVLLMSLGDRRSWLAGYEKENNMVGSIDMVQP